MFVANWTSNRCVAHEGSPTGCIYFTVGHVHRHSESWRLENYHVKRLKDGLLFFEHLNNVC